MYNNEKKKILCINYQKKNECAYDKKCKYAHGLEDQNIDVTRLFVYDILKNNNDLSNINIYDNKIIYNILLIHTKFCDKCKENKCPGGYNCKNGVLDKKYLICKKDLLENNCNDKDCSVIHLTNIGLKCYTVCKNEKLNEIITQMNITENDILTDSDCSLDIYSYEEETTPKSIFI